ncbi:SDR family oxidoreductase [Corynebacterium canis]|uniref:SDR family oxidoreductase n=1 Tax=Corynebacterium canis TaxID=679663 RepID=A0A5C5TZI8_9CORY|nr:SDR family oxidoreductase [Corynebacterium canis]TWT19019.1 SDR family oxidoreductase [Corynebacterium canis]
MRSVFISGAGAGIGRAVAEKFLAAGWMVGAYDINPVDYHHKNLVKGHLDVTDAASWDAALADFVRHTGGTIDVVDNNAGVLVDGPLETLTPDQVQAQINVNCSGVTLGARAAKRYLHRGSTLVNMSSASAIYGQPGIAVYSATKFYVAGLTEALNLEWSRDKIRVVAVWPLWAKTELADVKAPSARRLGVRITPEQVADVVWEAVHPANRWRRGHIHYGVSRLDKLLYRSRKLSPSRVARLLTRVVAG